MKILLATLFILFTISIFGCGNKIPQQGISIDSIGKFTHHKDTAKSFLLEDFWGNDSNLNNKVEEIFATINDTDRVAQMIMTSAGNNGKPFETVKKLITNKKVGGVILMGGSLESFKNDIAKFNSTVKQIKSLPLFYAIDAESGFVGSRIIGAPTFPPQSKIKSKFDSDTIGKKISKILKDVGFNINFAPVCDNLVNKEIINDRSFGNDPQKIIDFATSFIKSTQSNNIIATVKHFPGHGNVKGDSHKDLVFIEGNISELATFKEVLNSGALAVMVGHIAVKNNPENETFGLPSTLSAKIVTQLLRKKLGFKGLIITDALNMGAVTKFEKPSYKAALAGCDILLMPTDEVKLMNSILNEMDKNNDFKKQIYDSVKRIIRAKICLNLIQ